MLLNRKLSVRHNNAVPQRRRFSLATLRGMQQPGLSKRMNRIVKTENMVIGAYERAGRERVSIASQLSEWGESTEDEAVSDISDKLGVLLAEMGEQEDVFAGNLEDYRSQLKHIRDTESSVQPSRDYRAKVADDIQKQKIKDASSPKLETLEQELVRAEAQNLVAEAQLTNMTRQKLKEAYDVHLAAIIERGEKQILLAQHARRLLNYLDDTPIVPGDARKEYEMAYEAKQVLEDAEKDLASWQSTVTPIHTSAGQVPANTLLPAPARKAREAQRESMVAPDAATSTSDSIRDVNGSTADYQEYEPVATGGGVALGTAAPETGRYASGAGTVPADAKYMEEPALVTTRDIANAPDSAMRSDINRPTAGVPDMTSTGAGATREYDDYATDAAAKTTTIPSDVNGVYKDPAAGMTRDLEERTTGATADTTAIPSQTEGLYESTGSASRGMNNAAMDSQGYDGTAAYAGQGLHGSSTEARDFSSPAPGVTQGLDKSATGVSRDFDDSYGTAAADSYPSGTGHGRDIGSYTTEREDLFETTGGTVTGMEEAKTGSQDFAGSSTAAMGMNDSGRTTQGISRSTADAVTDTDGLAGAQESAGRTTDDFTDSYTSARSQGFSDNFDSPGSDVGGYIQESRDMDGSSTGRAMNGAQETKNYEESMTQDADGSMTTMTRETVVKNTKPLVDGGQATRERLQSQPMFGGFGLQTIGVPY